MDEAPDRRRWKALGVCLVAGFMTLLDVSIVNVALPSIKVGLVPAGRAGDAHGRRTVFMTGVALFSLASAVCGLAPSAGVLIAARLLQGCAGGLITPQISGFIQTLFRGQERGVAFGLFGTVVGISTAIGPLLGGLLIALFGTEEGWRAVFFVCRSGSSRWCSPCATCRRPGRATRAAPSSTRSASRCSARPSSASWCPSSSSAAGTARCGRRCSASPPCCWCSGCGTSAATAAGTSRW
jgi:hypothetical protein